MVTGIGQNNIFTISDIDLYVFYSGRELWSHRIFKKKSVYQSSAQGSCNGGMKQLDRRQNRKSS